MPTRLPRLNVTVTEEQHRLLLRLGELQGRSAASYLRELLDASTPVLRALEPMLEAQRTALEQTASEQTASMEVLARSLFSSAIDGADPAQLDMIDHIASLMANMGSDAAEAAAQARSGREEHRACAAADVASTPPSCNYGGQV